MSIVKTIPSIEIIPDNLNIALKHLILLMPIRRKDRFQIPHSTGEESQTQWRDLRKAEPDTNPGCLALMIPKTLHRGKHRSMWLQFPSWPGKPQIPGWGGDSGRSTHDYYGWEKVQSPRTLDMPCIIITLLNAKSRYHPATISLFMASMSRPRYKYLLCYQLRHYRNIINFYGLLKSPDYWYTRQLGWISRALYWAGSGGWKSPFQKVTYYMILFP